MVRTPVVKISKLVLPSGFEQVLPVEVRKEKDHLVKSGWPNVPNKHEGYGCGQGSMRLGDPLVLERDLVEEELDIGDPARCCRQEQGYRNVLSRRPPKVAGHEGQQEDRTDRRTPPTSSRFHGQIGRLRLPKVHPGVMSKEMRSV